MKKTLLTLTLAAVVAAGTILSGSFVSAASHDVVEGESIQAAVNAANDNDTINIAAGTYSGTVTVNKPLTILGAQAGVDARDRSGDETIINSVYAGGFSVQSPGVTIDGFTIDGDGADPYGRAIVLPVSTDASNLTVRNNIIQNNQTGVVTAYSATEGAGALVDGLTVASNKFADNNTTGAGASISLANNSSSDIKVIDNDFSNTDDGTDGNTNAITISGLLDEPTDNVLIRGNTSLNDGSFAHVYNVTNVTIDNNTADGQAGNGVLIGGGVGDMHNTSDITISNNTFTSSNNGVRLGNSAGEPISNVTISGNTISGMSTAGVMASEGSVGDQVVVTDNSITGNASGIVNLTSTAVDANNNWWGCEAGPGADGCDTTDGVVLASSWYVDDSLATTNLDGDESAPGVPNTGIAGSLSLSLLAGLAVASAAVVGSFLLYRRRSANKL